MASIDIRKIRIENNAAAPHTRRDGCHQKERRQPDPRGKDLQTGGLAQRRRERRTDPALQKLRTNLPYGPAFRSQRNDSLGTRNQNRHATVHRSLVRNGRTAERPTRPRASGGSKRGPPRSAASRALTAHTRPHGQTPERTPREGGQTPDTV